MESILLADAQSLAECLDHGSPPSRAQNLSNARVLPCRTERSRALNRGTLYRTCGDAPEPARALQQ